MKTSADKGAFRCTAEVPVRFRDTDGMGHVNNAVYLTYLEIARERYWRERFDLTDYRKIDLILARVEIDFRSPATVGETLVIGIRASAIGERSFEFTYEGWEKTDGRLIVAARSVQVMYDYAALASKPVSDQMRRALLAFEAPGSISLR
jgi:acyl-CoA thioester hydrolase